MYNKIEIIIIGGGLAGLTAGIHLLKAGKAVLLIEKNSYPQHKVCGEYISNEVVPYLKWLDADPDTLQPTAITKILFSTLSQKSIIATLPLGGFGVSRFKLDHFLYEKFLSMGGIVKQGSVTEISYENGFTVSTLEGQQYLCRQVIGAYGKRSVIDQHLKRGFMQQNSPFLAVKGHYNGEFDEDTVGLYNFKGGYCGVSKVEDQKINICYLADYKTFKLHKNITAYQQAVLYRHPGLKKIFENSTPLFEHPMTVGQLAFGKKEAVVDHILMIGDTAGLIHPLCGNGMGMAIHSAKICAELLLKFLNGSIPSREQMEKQYISLWNGQFQSRLHMGKILSGLLKRERSADLAMEALVRIPALLPLIIKRTHGKILTVNESC
jgi:flavin-dependent dehydrogenase